MTCLGSACYNECMGYHLLTNQCETIFYILHAILLITIILLFIIYRRWRKKNE